MKLFHLSDLHLGKRVNEFSMIDDQKYILKEIQTLISKEKPQAILVAGDIFDRSIPSEDAVMLWDEFLSSLAEKKIPVFAISGNHDSAIRFSEHSRLIDETGIHLSPAYDGKVRSFTLTAEFGEIDFFLLPFIKPANVKSFFPDEEIESYTDACRVAIEHMNVDASKRNVLVAHQFVTGATRCESEDISVGGIDNVDAAAFADFDYVALGHIHGKQSIGRDTVRYCGTPLKYSFSEKDHVKSVTVVEMGEKGDIAINEIPLKPLHDLREIKGKYEELTYKKNYENTDVNDYIHAILTDENDIIDAVGKLRVIYPNLMKLSYDNKRTRQQQSVTTVSEVEKKSPLSLFEEFYEKQNNDVMSAEQSDYVKKCIESIWSEHETT